jgi:hypothetical protein
VATKRRVRQLFILMVAAALLATAAGPQAASGQAGGAPTRTGRDARGVAVTLLTGDKVLLRDLPGRRHAVQVLPARRAGRPATFQTLSVRGDAYVLPSDVHAMVGRLLDPELFNVSALARMGYGDAKERLPLGGIGVDTVPVADSQPGRSAVPRWTCSAPTSSSRTGLATRFIPA